MSVARAPSDALHCWVAHALGRRIIIRVFAACFRRVELERQRSNRHAPVGAFSEWDGGEREGHKAPREFFVTITPKQFRYKFGRAFYGQRAVIVVCVQRAKPQNTEFGAKYSIIESVSDADNLHSTCV